MRALAAWCVRHRKVVLSLWLVTLVASFAISRGGRNRLLDEVPAAEHSVLACAQPAADAVPAVSGSSDQIVLHARAGTVRDAGVAAPAKRMLAEVARLPHVRSVTSPYSSTGATQISKDGTVAFATVVFDEQAQSLPKAAAKRLITTAQAAATSKLQVELNGQDIESAESQGSDKSTGIGVILALAVLGVAFGALFAAVLPLITALIAIGIGYSVTGLLSHAFSVASFSTILGVLIGLGVGVDYALFIVTRHRTGLKGGRTVEDAAVNAINTAGRAVFFAGVTVCIALLGQFALGVSFLYGVAISAAITVALTMFASLTLLPALLGLIGMKVLSRRQRAALRASGPVPEEVGGFWRRWAEGIQRHPLLPATLALAAVIVIAIPTLSLHLGLDDAGSDPAGTTSRQAYDLIAKGFGPGVSGPLQVVGKLPKRGDDTKFAGLIDTLAKQPGVVAATKPTVSPSGTVAVANLYPSTSPQSTRTSRCSSGCATA